MEFLAVGQTVASINEPKCRGDRWSGPQWTTNSWIDKNTEYSKESNAVASSVDVEVRQEKYNVLIRLKACSAGAGG